MLHSVTSKTFVNEYYSSSLVLNAQYLHLFKNSVFKNHESTYHEGFLHFLSYSDAIVAEDKVKGSSVARFGLHNVLKGDNCL